MHIVFPHAEAAEKGIFIVAEPSAGGPAFELLDVAAAQHHGIHDERGAKTGGDILDVALPFVAADALQAALADVILKRPALTIWKMSQFQRHDDFFHDERGAETRAQSQEQHAPALVTSQGLHGGVVKHS